MALWNQTGNALAEKRNNFLRDLVHGVDVIYRVMTTSGGTFDPISETMVGSAQVPQDTPFPKSALLVPIKKLDDSGEGIKGNQSMVVAGGRALTGVEIGTILIMRMHPKVPLNFDAIYLISNPILGAEPYKLDKIQATVAIGCMVCWNEVRMVRA